MNSKSPNLADSVALLTNTRSPKRRSGARRLRKLADPAACSDLLVALRHEVQDSRTWETQYQMVMALGTCSCKAGLEYLWQLARSNFEATMLYVAIGDAIVRLGRDFEADPGPMLAILATDNEMLIEGAFRATAMLQLRYEAATIETVLNYLRPRRHADGLRFWVAAAAPGWDSPHLEEFLNTCISGMREDVRQAAIAAKAKQYRQYNPL